jgi:monoamine oxidase
MRLLAAENRAVHVGDQSRARDVRSRRPDDYSGGTLGASLNPSAVQLEAEVFRADLNLVFHGAHAAARRVDRYLVAHLEHWPSNPLALGSYTCYQPGQFTTIARLEGVPVRNVFFAGEHANSFYE